ncbi:MAG: hypothetical protein NC433_05915 [Clostridiales bacterium]|nr:hypothetical protein [Clostridiales bacterium]
MKYTIYEVLVMEKIFTDENGEYRLDCSRALWATNQMHQVYHDAKVQLSDADFVIEDMETIMVIEYKNANIKKAVDLSYKTEPFNPMADSKFHSVIRKFYDSCHYLYLLGKSKPIQYIYVVETANGDATMRKRLRERMKTQLPFALQRNMNTGIKLIEKVDVVNIKEWNEDSTYGKYPFVQIDKIT